MNNLSPRERVLAIIVAALLGVFLLFVVGNGFYTSYRGQSQAMNGIAKRRGELELNVQRAKMAGDRRQTYRELSLHPDPSIAKTKYNAWLLKTAAEFGLGSPTVTKQGPIEIKQQGRVIANESRFFVKAEGDLKQFTKFLHHFHSTRILHRITDLTIQPERSDLPGVKADEEKKNRLTVNFTAEMLSLPDSKAMDQITTDDSLLQLASLDEYTSVILPRNMFGLPNNPPRFLTGDTEEADADKNISFSLRANDSDGDNLSYELIESEIAETKLTSSTSGARVTAPAVQEGEYVMKFRVSDDHPDSKSAELELTLVVENPPPPKPKEKKVEPPPFDPSSRTIITGLVRDRTGTTQVWISIKPTGERLKLTAGDEFEVGPHEGRVVEFAMGGVVVEVDDELAFFKPNDSFDKPRDLPAGYKVN